MRSFTRAIRERIVSLLNWSLLIGFFLGFMVGMPSYKILDRLYFYLFRDRNINQEPLPPKIKRIDKVEENWSIQLDDGNVITPDTFKGKVVFLNMWATWCPPCRAEMPSIQRLYDKIKDERFLMLCLTDEKSTRLAEFQSKNKYSLPLYSFNGDVPLQFDYRGIPTTFILSRQGKVAAKHVGAAKWDDSTCVAFIQNLLNE